VQVRPLQKENHPVRRPAPSRSELLKVRNDTSCLHLQESTELGAERRTGQFFSWNGLSLVLGLFALLSPAANAGPVEYALSEARVAIEDAEFEQARALLEGSRESAATSDEIILNDSLARVEYYLGIIEYYDGDPDEGAMGFWRKSLILSPGFAWDTSLVAEQDARDIFEALRSEIRQRNQVTTGVSSDEIEDFRVYIDGNLAHDYDLVTEGRHLVQVACPDNTVKGLWADFGEAPDYLDLCGIVQETEEPEVGRSGREPRDWSGPSGLQIGLWSGGGALVAGGAAMYFLSVSPSLTAIEDARDDPTQVSRSDADDLTAAFNRGRLVEGVLLGAGFATAGVAFFIDDDLAIVPTGTGGVLTGRF